MSDTTPNFTSKVSTQNKETRARISGAQELAEVWRNFLQKKFSATEREKTEREFAALPECKEQDELKWEEYDNAVRHMKNAKSTGIDGTPAEV